METEITNSIDSDVGNVKTSDVTPVESKKFIAPDTWNGDVINLRSVIFNSIIDINLSNYENCSNRYDDINVEYDIYNMSRSTKDRILHTIYGEESDDLDGSKSKPTIFTIPIVDVNYEPMLVNYVFDEYFNNKINIVNTNLITHNDSSNSLSTVSFNIQDTTIEYFTITFNNFGTRFILCNLKYELLKESLNRLLSNDSIINNSASGLLNSLYMHKMKDYLSDGFDLITEKFISNQFTQTAVMISTEGEFKAESGVYCMSNNMFKFIVNDVSYIIRNMFDDAENLDSFLESYGEFYEKLPVFEFDLDEETAYLIKGDLYD